MHKKHIIISLISIALLCVLVLMFMIMSLSKQAAVYSVDITDGELSLKNFRIVTYDSYCYIPDSFLIERISDEKEINNAYIEVSSKAGTLFDWAFPFEQRLSVNAPIDRLNKNIRLTDDSNITVKFKYSIDGVEKEFYEVIKLKNYIRFK